MSFGNQKGVTLLETLAGLVIITAIILIFFAFFGQSVMFSSKVDERYTSSHLAEQIMHDVQNSNLLLSHLESHDFTAGCTEDVLRLPDEEDAVGNGFSMETLGFNQEGTGPEYYYPGGNNRFKAAVEICQADTREQQLGLYRVKVTVFEQDGRTESHLIDYMQER